MLRQVFAYYSLSKALLLKMKQRIINDVRLIKENEELNEGQLLRDAEKKLKTKSFAEENILKKSNPVGVW